MPRPWLVLPHRPIDKLLPNFWAAEGDLPAGPLQRRMGIGRFADGRLVFLNAFPLDEAAMREIEAFGEPAFVVVPNGFHRIDLAPFKTRYPKVRILCLAGALKKASEKVAIDGDLSLLPADPSLRVEEMAGCKMGDVAGVASSGGIAAICFPGEHDPAGRL